MTSCFRIFMLLIFLCQPFIVLAGQDEKKALMEYLVGDRSHLESLLAPDFQYHFFINNTENILSRDQDMEAMSRLATDTVDHDYVAKIDRIYEYKSHAGQFRVKFDIPFHDSPKIWPGSFFRGADLEIDQIFIVKLEKSKIVRIEEIREKKTSKLLFGNLKTIYLKNLTTEDYDDKSLLKLFDRDSHTLLVWKKLRLGTATDYLYYWPNNHLIENLYGNSE
jgi:hypothetical protein